MSTPIATLCPNCKIMVQLEGASHIRFNQRIYRFDCTICEETLQLDGRVLEKFYVEKATGLIEHIFNNQVAPWIEQHMECAGVRSLSA